jgi:hypothetical protein
VALIFFFIFIDRLIAFPKKGIKPGTLSIRWQLDRNDDRSLYVALTKGARESENKDVIFSSRRRI